jgi:hypothetical protein
MTDITFDKVLGHQPVSERFIIAVDPGEPIEVEGLGVGTWVERPDGWTLRFHEQGQDRAEGPGCPSCGSPDDLFVTASAIGFADLTITSPHIDGLEWGPLHDVDIGEAKNLQCGKCSLFQDVDGDKDLPELLGLKSGDDE